MSELCINNNGEITVTADSVSIDCGNTLSYISANNNTSAATYTTTANNIPLTGAWSSGGYTLTVTAPTSSSGNYNISTIGTTSVPNYNGHVHLGSYGYAPIGDYWPETKDAVGIIFIDGDEIKMKFKSGKEMVIGKLSENTQIPITAIIAKKKLLEGTSEE